MPIKNPNSCEAIRKRLPVDSLRPHPLQSQFFDPPTSEERQGLADDIRANGLREPIQVLPSPNAANLPGMTVLDGISRIAAVKHNGGSEIDAVVRHDLAAKTSTELLAIFLGFNLERRQLHVLDRAACLLHVLQAKAGKTSGFNVGSPGERNARDQVGKMLGVSGRHLQRLFRILLLPRPLQKVVRDGLLPMVLAEKINVLSKDTQIAIAESIAATRDAATIRATVTKSLPAIESRSESPTKACEKFLRMFKQHLPALERHTKHISRRMLDGELDTLRRGRKLFDGLVKAAAKFDEAAERENLEKLFSDIGSLRRI